jgi:hypothetical protein
MPLNENAINEILPFAPDAQESSGDVLPLADYKTDTMRARGHQPGIARRDLANRVSRQAAHMAAGIAQFIANRYAVGVKDDGNLDALEAGMLEALWAEITKHDDNPTAHGEAFQALATHIQDKDDPHETLPPGGEAGQVIIKQEDGSLAWGAVAGMPVGTPMYSYTGVPLPGTVAINVKQKFLLGVYPQLDDWVRTCGNYLTTEAEWDAEAAAQYGTCAKFCLTDMHIILPCDLHYHAAAQPGVAGKQVGDWAEDAIRNIEAVWSGANWAQTESGAVFRDTSIGGYTTSASVQSTTGTHFDASRVVPTAEENLPKTSYLLPCIKVADIAINASQVDMLALAAQVAQINGDKVDKGDAEYRSIVELKGSRSTTGTWTITGLVIGKPLLVTFSGGAAGNNYFRYRVLSGSNDGYSASDSYTFEIHQNVTPDSTPHSTILIPTAATVEIAVVSIGGSGTIRAYQ